ncbi:MAG: DUF3024 domain-containing protein [Actinomycetota bacterium]
MTPQIKGSLPELVRRNVERAVGRYCEERVPPHVRDKIRMEHEIRGNSVTIVERRPPWREDVGPEWSRLTVAQLRYEEEKWALYWSDRNGKWHFYDVFDPTPDLSAALAEIDDDPTAIFWG